jgi:hypothetical protein
MVCHDDSPWEPLFHREIWEGAARNLSLSALFLYDEGTLHRSRRSTANAIDAEGRALEGLTGQDQGGAILPEIQTGLMRSQRQ